MKKRMLYTFSFFLLVMTTTKHCSAMRHELADSAYIATFDPARDSHDIQRLLENIQAKQPTSCRIQAYKLPAVEQLRHLFKNEITRTASPSQASPQTHYFCKVLRFNGHAIGLSCYTVHICGEAAEYYASGTISLLLVDDTFKKYRFEFSMLKNVLVDLDAFQAKKLSMSNQAFNWDPQVLTQLGFCVKHRPTHDIFKLKLQDTASEFDS